MLYCNCKSELVYTRICICLEYGLMNEGVNECVMLEGKIRGVGWDGNIYGNGNGIAWMEGGWVA